MDVILRTAAVLALLSAFTPLRAQEFTADSEAETLAQLRKVATNVQFHDDGTVRLVRLSKPQVTDESLALLPALPRIDYLAVTVTGVTDTGIAHVAALRDLDTLMLCESGVGDDGLRAITELPRLERLYLDDTAIGDAGLAHLSRLSSLKVLSLRRTGVTDAGLAALQSLSNLEALFLDGCQITDTGLADLASLPALKTLHLNGTAVTGLAGETWSRFAALEFLNLTDCPLDPSAGDALLHAPKLRHLTLYRTGLTAVDGHTLREQRPELEVFCSPGPPGDETAQLIARFESMLDPPEGSTSVEPALRADLRFVAESSFEMPDFQRHVIPLLGRLGCNGRSCHGSFQGQGGFRLSMFGYDFAADHEALTGGNEPRVNVDSPADSLILYKPTSEDDHGGGVRFQPGGWEEALLKRWIAAGAHGRADDAPHFVRLDVSPATIDFHALDEQAQLRAVAVWSDGSREDVTPLSRYRSNDEGVADVDPDGLVTCHGPGDTHIIVMYDNGVVPVPVLKPVSDLATEDYPQVPQPTRIDELVVEKLRRLGIVPAELCTDEEFLRRVGIDLIGTLPTPDEIRAFCANPAPNKRSRKIDELLDRPAYVTWWTLQFCDLTGSNAGYLGSTEMAQPVAQEWRDWIERRVAENAGWDDIARGIVLGTSRRPGQTYEEHVVEQSGYTRRAEPDDYAADSPTMPHYWFRDNQSQPRDKALAFGYVFLGVRLECAECHKHPFDQWSQQDFQLFTEFFTRIKAGTSPDAVETRERMREMLGVPVKLDTAALRRQSYLRIASEGRPIPWKEVYVDAPPSSPEPARLLGGPELDLSEFADPREPLAAWLTHPRNPYFARAFVNRIWGHYSHRGIIDPTDDLNLANPPANGPLLDYLADAFVDSGFDIRWLHREITNSRTYQLSWRSNDTNRADERNFSRAVIRRLPAEVIVDAIRQSTANSKYLAGVSSSVTGRSIGDHPRSYQARVVDYPLLVFGKPLRTTNCDCERQSAPTLLQALYMRNDEEIFRNLDRPDGWLAELRAAETPPAADQLVTAAYLRTLNRIPSTDELHTGRTFLDESDDPLDGLRDLLWALLNSQEFITNH